jgi:hypothetical protein
MITSSSQKYAATQDPIAMSVSDEFSDKINGALYILPTDEEEKKR